MRLEGIHEEQTNCNYDCVEIQGGIVNKIIGCKGNALELKET
jgi:hypothetical protein